MIKIPEDFFSLKRWGDFAKVICGQYIKDRFVNHLPEHSPFSEKEVKNKIMNFVIIVVSFLICSSQIRADETSREETERRIEIRDPYAFIRHICSLKGMIQILVVFSLPILTGMRTNEKRYSVVPRTEPNVVKFLL